MTNLAIQSAQQRVGYEGILSRCKYLDGEFERLLDLCVATGGEQTYPDRACDSFSGNDLVKMTCSGKGIEEYRQFGAATAAVSFLETADLLEDKNREKAAVYQLRAVAKLISQYHEVILALGQRITEMELENAELRARFERSNTHVERDGRLQEENERRLYGYNASSYNINATGQDGACALTIDKV